MPGGFSWHCKCSTPFSRRPRNFPVANDGSAVRTIGCPPNKPVDARSAAASAAAELRDGGGAQQAGRPPRGGRRCDHFMRTRTDRVISSETL